ncbi:unnamed protein product [Darwinula stevensoni]|uniref:Uncharacterized protein n=1 Tax=Darwinula stevensoni TaxID=69355 RepID=A0A7R8X3I5_9CRUS|nr:unnamed protein product [Darwinula stevensoni]CAG0884996.1 unnamed protein product [Darwinula stevensoni]
MRTVPQVIWRLSHLIEGMKPGNKLRYVPSLGATQPDKDTQAKDLQDKDTACAKLHWSKISGSANLTKMFAPTGKSPELGRQITTDPLEDGLLNEVVQGPITSLRWLPAPPLRETADCEGHRDYFYFETISVARSSTLFTDIQKHSTKGNKDILFGILIRIQLKMS